MTTRPVIEIVQHRAFVAVPATTTIRHTAQKMKESHEGAILIVQHGRLVGICTERDMVFKAIAEGVDLDSTPVSTIMTAHPECISPEKPFCHALHIMFEGGFRHVPVIDTRGHPLGIVSARDALGIEALEFDHELLQRESVTEIL